jgi:hypothetical protein
LPPLPVLQALLDMAKMPGVMDLCALLDEQMVPR